MALELQIQEKDGPARTQVVPRDVAFFGRREDNDVILPFTFVSSRHGRILRRGSALFVEDMGSTNGTTVNGKPLTPMVPQAISPEDAVEIEKVSIRARLVEEFDEPDVPATFHEDVPRPVTSPRDEIRETVRLSAAQIVTPAAVPLPPPEPRPAPTTMWEIQTGAALGAAARAEAAEAGAAARLGQASLGDVIATGRLRQRMRADESDRYFLWEMFFKALGLAAILAGLVLMVVVLAA